MASFDYDNLKAVGIVSTAGSNAYIYVLGYSYLHDYKIIPYSADNVREIFPEKGRVFAYNFNKLNPSYENCCIGLKVKPSDRMGEGLDDYVWDWSGDIHFYSSPILKLDKENIGENGEENYRILESNNLLDLSSDCYILSNGRIFLIKAHSIERMIKYWTLSDIEEKCPESVIVYNSKFYIIDKLCENTGVVDITTDDQLMEWFSKKVLKPNWSAIMESKDHKKVEQHIKDVLGGVNIESNIYDARLRRIKTLNTNFRLTIEHMDDIEKNPWFASILSEAISEFKERYVDQLSVDQKAEIENLKKTHERLIQEEKERFENAKANNAEEFSKRKTEFDRKLSDIESEIKVKQNELESIQSAVLVKQEEINRQEGILREIENRKADIVKDFSIVKEVLSSSGIDNNIQKKKRIIFQCTSVQEENTPALYYQVFLKRLEDCLKAFGADRYNDVNIPELMTRYWCLMTKDIRTILSILVASGKCKYLTTYVNPNWKSFSDLWENGLEFIVSEARNNPDQMHYLILRNMNLSYIPSYIQPLLDLRYGLSIFPQMAESDYPLNLRVLGTINDDPLIPVTKASVMDIGCITPLEFSNTIDAKIIEDLPHGYLTPEQLNAVEDKEFKREDFSDFYITKDE